MSAIEAFLSTWSQARATFGDGPPQAGDSYDRSSALTQLRDRLDTAKPEPVWSGAAASKYSDMNFRHQGVIGRTGELDVQLARQVDRSAQIVSAGRQQLDSVRHWVLSASAAVPDDVTARVTRFAIASAGLRRVTEIVSTANSALNDVGRNISAIGDQYRDLRPGAGGRGQGAGDVQAVDFREAPPPSGYPINDVIAKATDLDGNHVVLRRGYYDATTQQGFGWDKAYWRHHVVNPNIFTDLISHSRPTRVEGGTAVYDVPINRVHCAPGFLGIPDCNDTGESVTMRIVANLNENNPTVPDGGQKGVITMYPLAGGSGVVELQPGWTLTPPWVNNNAPIN